MKTKIIIITLVALFLVNFADAQIKLNYSNSYIGIGTSAPSYPIDLWGGTVRIVTYPNYSNLTIGFTIYPYDGVTPNIEPLQSNCGSLGIANWWGSAYITNIYSANPLHVSDSRLKENILPVSNALDKIKRIKSYQYNYKPGIFNSKIDSLNKMNSPVTVGKQFGFIAQQLDTVVKDAVVFDSIHQFYGIRYDDIVSLLVAAMNEQQAQIDSLKQLVNNNKSNGLKSAKVDNTLTAIETEASISQSVLYQNAPNPFNQNTIIAYYLSQTVKSATIYVYNMEGNQVKDYPINGMGNGSIIITGSELKPGMYLYALIADGVEIDTKRMILTK
jgi:ACT domain-containing protein